MLDPRFDWRNRDIYEDEEEKKVIDKNPADVLIIGGGHEFLPMAVDTEMKNRHYTVKHTDTVVNDVNEAGSNVKVYLVMIDIADKVRDLLVYLKDVAFERRTLVGLVGERVEINEAAKYLGSENVSRLFARPIDAKAISDGLEEMLEESAKRNEKKRILIIDDDPEYLRRTQKVLHNQYKVYIANSGASGIMLLTKHKVDLILLDYMMPILDGPKTIEALKSEPETQDIPVMFLTGKTDTKAVIKGMTLGADNYLAKSLSADDLIATISDFFAKSDWKAATAW